MRYVTGMPCSNVRHLHFHNRTSRIESIRILSNCLTKVPRTFCLFGNGGIKVVATLVEATQCELWWPPLQTNTTSFFILSSLVRDTNLNFKMKCFVSHFYTQTQSRPHKKFRRHFIVKRIHWFALPFAGILSSWYISNREYQNSYFKLKCQLCYLTIWGTYVLK